MLRLLLILMLAVVGYLYLGEFWGWANIHLARTFSWLFP